MAKIVSKSRGEPGKSPAAAAHRPVGEAHRTIHVRGAREHNLKNVDLEIPRDALIVFTGLSGSGKSSLAFDTIYAEGQRRYVESLSAYARQFLEMMQKPDVDHIDGLSPAISIEQKTTSKNPRSTVGTVTEIYDYLRLLFARVGVPYSPATGLPIESQTVQQMVDRVLALPEGTRLYLLAPIVRGRKGEYRKELAELQKKGFQRVKINGALLRDRRRAQARQEVQARHRRGGGPHRRARRTSAHAAGRQLRDGAGAGRRHRHRRVCRQAAEGVPSPLVGRGTGRGGATTVLRIRPTPSPSPQGGEEDRRYGGKRPVSAKTRTSCATRTRRTSASRSRRALPVRCPASPSTRSSRGCSRSTRRPAPAPSATGSAPSCASRPTSSCPTATLSLKQGAVYPWAKTGQHLALLRADAGGAGQALQGVDDDAVGEAAQEGAGRHPVRHRRRGGRRSSTRTACASTPTPSRSRA